MDYRDYLPAQIQQVMAALPQDNCGRFYYTVRHKLLPIQLEYELEAWGTICDGTDQREWVKQQMKQKLRFLANQFRYVSWRTVPAAPELHKHPTSGRVTA